MIKILMMPMIMLSGNLYSSFEPIVEYIKSNDVRIIYVYENHYIPEHRLFTACLIENLSNRGINLEILAAEMFDLQIEEFNGSYIYDGVYGGYVQEPYAAELVFSDYELGLELIAYDGGKDYTRFSWPFGVEKNRRNEREVPGAFKIANAISESADDTLTVVHAGGGHISRIEKNKSHQNRSSILDNLFDIRGVRISQIYPRHDDYRRDKSVKNTEFIIVPTSQVYNNSGDIRHDFEVLHPNFSEITDREKELYFSKICTERQLYHISIKNKLDHNKKYRLKTYRDKAEGRGIPIKGFAFSGEFSDLTALLPEEKLSIFISQIDSLGLDHLIKSIEFRTGDHTSNEMDFVINPISAE
ncbi:MAG: hypothetical protein ACFB2Z_12500 [Maricaulaceae bacterium]